MMTKQDFQEFATEFGALARIEGWTGYDDADDTFVNMVRRCKAVFRDSNPLFSATTFDNWMWEVATGVRGLDGKRAKK